MTKRYDEAHKEERRERDQAKAAKLKEYEATIERLKARVAELEKEREQTDLSTNDGLETAMGPSKSNANPPKDKELTTRELRRRLEVSENENYMLNLELRQLQNQNDNCN